MYAVFAYLLYGLLAYLIVMSAALLANDFIPAAPPLLGFIGRVMSAYIAFLVCAIYGTIASALLKPFGLQYKYAQWTTARAFKFLGKVATGVEFVFVGNGERVLETTKPAVILGNHQTELDILMLGSLFPTGCSVTAKKSLKSIPFLGWFMTLSGAIFIDRADRSQAMKAFESAAAAMKSKSQSCFMFPEGTRSYSDEPMLLPFKKGAFHLAVQAQVPIIPTVAENYSRVLNVKAKRFNAGTLRIKVLPVIETKGKTAADVDSLLQQARESMLNALKEMHADSHTTGETPHKKAA